MGIKRLAPLCRDIDARHSHSVFIGRVGAVRMRILLPFSILVLRWSERKVDIVGAVKLHRITRDIHRLFKCEFDHFSNLKAALWTNDEEVGTKYCSLILPGLRYPGVYRLRFVCVDGQLV